MNQWKLGTHFEKPLASGMANSGADWISRVQHAIEVERIFQGEKMRQWETDYAWLRKQWHSEGI